MKRPLLLGGFLAVVVLSLLAATYQNYYVTNPVPTISPQGSNAVLGAFVLLTDNRDVILLKSLTVGTNGLTVNGLAEANTLHVIGAVTVGGIANLDTANALIGFNGDGHGLTNLNLATQATNFPAGPTYVYHGKVTFISNVVFVLPPIGDGSLFTNVLEKNVSVTTNAWGSAVGDFSLGTALTTNLAGDLTLTGISGFSLSNWNFQTIDMDANGATRLITVPAGWTVSGAFTNATTGALTNGTRGELRLKAIIGRNTNADLSISQ